MRACGRSPAVIATGMPAEAAGAQTKKADAIRVRVIVVLSVQSQNLREQRRCLGDSLGCPARDRLERVLEALVDHAGTDVGPARRLVLLGEDLLPVLELAANSVLERVEVESCLLFEAIIEEAADLE